jgi:hypothetical protein
MQRVLDIVFTSLALLVLSPLMIPLVIILRFSGEREIFYKQNRVGIKGKYFGLPIIYPDLPYARMLSGNQAIYFDPYDVELLYAAIIRLSQFKQEGCWPDCKEQLKSIPKNWQQVAGSMLEITLN